MSVHEFTEIYLPISGTLYKVAYYLLESEEDARDAVQDLYLKLWGMADTLHLIKNPKAYAVTLLRNICIDRIRHNSINVHSSCVVNESYEENLYNKERLVSVLNAIDRLPARQKLVMRMSAIEDMKYEEITDITGMNNLTIRVLMSQARKKLKELE